MLQPDDNCSKTGRGVLDVLRDKHPWMRSPEVRLEDPDRLTVEGYESVSEPVPLSITDETVQSVAASLSGAAGAGVRIR